jgi:hypothetical protein
VDFPIGNLALFATVVGDLAALALHKFGATQCLHLGAMFAIFEIRTRVIVVVVGKSSQAL